MKKITAIQCNFLRDSRKCKTLKTEMIVGRRCGILGGMVRDYDEKQFSSVEMELVAIVIICVSLYKLMFMISIVQSSLLSIFLFIFIVFITLGSYVAIVRPLHRRNSKKQARRLLIIIWILSALLAAPSFIYSETESKV